MNQNNCFICSCDCKNSHLYILNLESKKNKTEYTSLIGDLIDPEYELRVANNNKICERCSLLLEKFDELQHEVKMFKSILGRQLANSYNIKTTEPLIYMDISKTFATLPLMGNKVNKYQTKYSCKICRKFVTDCIDAVNSHIIYHQLLKGDPISAIEGKKAEAIKTSQTKRRETNEISETATPTIEQSPSPSQLTARIANREETKIDYDVEMPEVIQEASSNINIQFQEYDEATLESLIDLKMLEDPFYDSNLKNKKCMIKGCTQEFKYVCDYIRHLKLKHKSTPAHIFGVVRSNIKRPKKVHKLMCPYCFTTTADKSRLAEHVKKHEASGKSNLFVDRLNGFMNSVMSSARCTTCDCEILDTSLLECNHEIVRNGMASKTSCLYCPQEFYSDKLYHNHLALSHGHCFICSSTCHDKDMLADHIRSHLSHAEYSCGFCNDIYQTEKDRHEHTKLNHSERCCMYCDEYFVDKDELTDHVRYSHADKRMEEQKSCICDACGGSFKNQALYSRHQLREHKKRSVYTCTTCDQTFRFRYLLMDHMTTIHRRTIFDSEKNFYKCFICSQGFSSQSRKAFVQHLHNHNKSSSYCSDCNVHLESVHHLEAHRERSHQDFSFLVEKKNSPPTPQSTTELKQKINLNKNPEVTMHSQPKKSQGSNFQVMQGDSQLYEETIVDTQFSVDNQTSNLQIPQADSQLYEETVVDHQISAIEQESNFQLPQSESQDHYEETVVEDQLSVIENESNGEQQQIMVQTEDGSLLNMNNFILTENGDLIIRDLDLWTKNQEGGGGGGESNSGGQIHFSNLDEFLLEQGIPAGTEISYIQQSDESQVIIQNDDGTASQNSQESLMQTYKEIFERDGDIPTELIQSSEVQDGSSSKNLSLNGEGNFVVELFNSNPVVGKVELATSEQIDANQSTLDELGDILLEVAAAAEKEKKPKLQRNEVRETLWGKRKATEESINNNGSSSGSSKKRGTVKNNFSDVHSKEIVETPASNFSQAYEFFVKGFDAKKQKNF